MFLNLKCIQILLFSIIIANPQNTVTLKTLTMDFEREYKENNKTEKITGTLHYDVQNAKVVVEVKKPIKQIMVVKNNVLEIYYPLEKQAFRFVSQGRIPLPFIESIIQSTQAEYGLTAIGYTLDKHDIVDNVLYTYWQPPEKVKEKLGSIILGISEDKLISAEVKNPEGKIITRSIYTEHKRIGINHIPMKVTSHTYGNKSEEIVFEQIIYTNPKVNVDDSNSILNFTIPESIKIKEVEW